MNINREKSTGAKNFDLRPIGITKGGRITVKPEYCGGLQGLGDREKIVVIYWDGRPGEAYRLGFEVVKLIKIIGNEVFVEGITDGLVVLDIKPHFPALGI